MCRWGYLHWSHNILRCVLCGHFLSKRFDRLHRQTVHFRVGTQSRCGNVVVNRSQPAQSNRYMYRRWVNFLNSSRMQGFSSSGKIKMNTCLALQSMNSSCSELLDHEYCTGVNFYHWMSQQEQPCSCNSFYCHQMDHRVQVPRPKKKENVLIISTIKSFKSLWSKET